MRAQAVCSKLGRSGQSSANSKVCINKQSPDIAGGMHVGKDEMDVGAGDQGIMFGYASDETEDCMPLTHLVATRLGKKLTDVRKDGSLWWLRPDGKTQVIHIALLGTDRIARQNERPQSWAARSWPDRRLAVNCP